MDVTDSDPAITLDTALLIGIKENTFFPTQMGSPFVKQNDDICLHYKLLRAVDRKVVCKNTATFFGKKFKYVLFKVQAVHIRFVLNTDFKITTLPLFLDFNLVKPQ